MRYQASVRFESALAKLPREHRELFTVAVRGHLIPSVRGSNALSSSINVQFRGLAELRSHCEYLLGESDGSQGVTLDA